MLAASPPRVPFIFLCCNCDAETHSPDHRIPVGWSQTGADVFCPDCTVVDGIAVLAGNTIVPVGPTPATASAWSVAYLPGVRHYALMVDGSADNRGIIAEFKEAAAARLASSAPDFLRAAQALMASPFAANYRLISPFKELAAAIAKATGQ